MAAGVRAPAGAQKRINAEMQRTPRNAEKILMRIHPVVSRSPDRDTDRPKVLKKRPTDWIGDLYGRLSGRGLPGSRSDPSRCRAASQGLNTDT